MVRSGCLKPRDGGSGDSTSLGRITPGTIPVLTPPAIGKRVMSSRSICSIVPLASTRIGLCLAALKVAAVRKQEFAASEHVLASLGEAFILLKPNAQLYGHVANLVTLNNVWQDWFAR